MKAYYANKRIGSGGEIEASSVSAERGPYEVLDRTYASADLSDIQNGAQLMQRVNNPANPVCVAMTIEEARGIVEHGHKNRIEDVGRFLDSLIPGSLVVLEPYGSDLDPKYRNNEYLPDLALSGKSFPKILNTDVWPSFFGKSMFKPMGIGNTDLKRMDEPITVRETPGPDYFDLIAKELKSQ